MDTTFKALKPILFAAALIAAITPVSDKAEATLVLTLQSGSTTVVVTDNGVGDMDPHLGMIGFMGAVGNFNMNMVGGIGNAMAPLPTLMDLHGMNMSTSNGGTLIATLEDDGYLAPWPNFSLISSIGGTVGAGGSLSSTAYLDPTSTTGVPGATIASHGPFPTMAFGSDASTAPFGFAAPFGLAIQVVITHTGAALSSYDHEIRIAEPATLALFGLMLAGVGVLLGRRNRGRN